MMPGRRAGSGIGKYSYNADSPKQGSKRFNSITKTIHFAYLGILLIYSQQYAAMNLVGQSAATSFLIGQQIMMRVLEENILQQGF